jgi:hypothetical protein
MGESFFFGPEARKAQQKIKEFISTAPVLVRVDYEKAKLATRHYRPPDDDGLVIVTIDSSMYGSGWVVYQMQNTEKHPTLFGSCTARLNLDICNPRLNSMVFFKH